MFEMVCIEWIVHQFIYYSRGGGIQPLRVNAEGAGCDFNTDFHGIKYGFSHNWVYLCHICDNRCYLLPNQPRRYSTFQVEYRGL